MLIDRGKAILTVVFIVTSALSSITFAEDSGYDSTKFWTDFAKAVAEGRGESFMEIEKLKSRDSATRTDVLSTSAHQEAHFVDNDTYLSCTNKKCEKLLNYSLSKGTQIEVLAEKDYFTITAGNTEGTGKKFFYDSRKNAIEER